MKWRDLRRSSNVDDRRGQGPRGAGAAIPIAALLRFLPMLLRTKLGKGVLVLAALYFGYQYLTGGGMGLQQQVPQGAQTQSPDAASAAPDEDRAFVAAILGTTEDLWTRLLPGYRAPTLVLYTDMTPTGCGVGQARTGPFYCPADEQIYLDLGFMAELKKLGAPGDFAFAYVIAHEVAHHVQNLQGISGKVQDLRQQASDFESNRLSVRLELQADCYAGVWGHHVANELGILEAGDLEEGLTAASAIGDDRLQRMAGRAVQPEAFTHGSSAQRVQWFRQGYDTGQPDTCNTFTD